ncbi:related to TAP42, component of the Tor signaling pathway [Fusarium torulosum]|uniref:Related to TAP42, component of the Tor signaling pathway n=1 Tax=Fusarium torulosum TaxID=33205 RepID=A0AAE8SH45_9HYPO|nr:related to TAP42, component of the Tor signaling pathway [Fusarium torulosum]
MSSEEPHSLRSLYEAAEEKRRALENAFEATSPAYRSDLEAALSLYASARDQISALALFSPNEGIEDVSTSDLPYLLLDAHIAELVQKTPNQSPDQRLEVLAKSRAAYERFLAAVDGYGLVQAPYNRVLERYRDEPESFAVVASNDAAARRDGKIANYRAEKALKEKLEMLRRNPRYVEEGDEELVRELYLTQITFAVHSALQALDSMNREVEILAHAPRPLAPSSIDTPSADDHSYRLDQPLRRLQSLQGGPLLSKQGKPLQPFTLVGSRDQMARDVFRSGHNLPTMSIDEYLEEEKRQGNILQGGVEEKKVVDEDDIEAVDREMYKQREWDEFVDHNPKGAGNTLNRG